MVYISSRRGYVAANNSPKQVTSTPLADSAGSALLSTSQLNKLACLVKEQPNGSVLIDLPLSKGLDYTRVLPREFVEWFRGRKKIKIYIFLFLFFFTDAEGTFGFRLNSGTSGYRFKYQITLHHDDLKVLHYIRDTLNIGNAYPSKDKTTPSFSVVSQSALKILIAIFAKYILNTTKHLDFLAFTSAYELYTQDSSRVARLEPIKTYIR